MAFRISGVGQVTVSERRSMGFMTGDLNARPSGVSKGAKAQKRIEAYPESSTGEGGAVTVRFPTEAPQAAQRYS